MGGEGGLMIQILPVLVNRAIGMLYCEIVVRGVTVPPCTMEMDQLIGSRCSLSSAVVIAYEATCKTGWRSRQ